LRYNAGMFACHFCGTAIDDPRAVFRDSACAACHRDLKVCRNCRFYSPGAHWDCAETIDEQVRDKERGNFCTFFSFRDAAAKAEAPGRKADASTQARRKLDALFGNDS
jgi:hypothetical protein